MEKDIQRFIDYVKIDTQSNAESETTPSEEKELVLTRRLQQDLKEMGIDSYINEFGILYGKLEGEKGLDPIGFNAHVDTAEELSGKDVKPQIIKNYDGGIIKLNDEYSMSPKEFPTLGNHIGDDLVVTSGDTLLGADDKAGLAIIMAMLEFYKSHPEIKHHPICFCFTPDEEIGRGPEHFDAKEFGAKYAYTIDGAAHNEIAVETFNAAHADLLFKGIAIHPGEAKGRMVNSINLAMEFDKMLPEFDRPQYTCGHEGFNHMTYIEGGTDQTRTHYIIRNHDGKKLEEQKALFVENAKKLKEKYPGCDVVLSVKDDYRNMKEVLDVHPEALEQAKKAFDNLGIDLKFDVIRGGTDGATFSFKGCPTPNLGTGSFNHHGRFEYLSINEFRKMIEIVKEIVKA